MKFVLRADGGSRGNPGPAASGAVLYELRHGVEQEVATAVLYLGETTNNVAEYTAIIIGLNAALAHGVKELRVELDSELAVKQLNGEYRIKQAHLQDLAMKVRFHVAQFRTVTFHHIRREYNKRADELVNITLDSHK